MSFSELFHKKAHVFLPVIHVKDLQQTWWNAQIAMDNGADGVFLINHGITHLELLDIFAKLRLMEPNIFIGVNLLGVSRVEALELLYGLSKRWQANAVWVDDAGYHDLRNLDTQREKVRKEISKFQIQSRWSFMYFGGVAFKGQRMVGDYLLSTRLASEDLLDVIVTSGEATGIPPKIEKIEAMYEITKGRCDLGVASGMSAENVGEYMPYVKYFLVSTSISGSFYYFDWEKVAAFAKALKK